MLKTGIRRGSGAKGMLAAGGIFLILGLAACGGGGDSTAVGGSTSSAQASEVTAMLLGSVAVADNPLVPVAASASSSEAARLGPEKAIDGNAGTRWSSAFSDQQWIQLDFGAPADIGRLRIHWQSSYAKEYDIQVSDDATSWTTIRKVADGKGGIEEITGLAGSGRYLRIQGIARSSGYGYSIYEVTAWGTPPVPDGSDGTPPPAPPQTPTPPVTQPEPPAGSGPGAVTAVVGDATVNYFPLFAEGAAVIEPIQYREPDGTLVTFMGARPTHRHARERGEPWDAPDTGPGHYLSFPPFYFQNRTFGLEIRDTIPAGGKKIEVYLHVNDGVFDGTTFSLFRNINNPNVTGFGWSLNYGFNNPMEGGKPICRAGQRSCMMSFNSNWRTSPHSPLKIGDKIELAPAPRLQRPVIDGGGERYYSFEQLYVVGVGLRPWYGIAPNLDSEPLPLSTLLGGLTSVSYNYSEEPHLVFQQMANNIGIVNSKRFVEGRRLFHTSFIDGTHSEHPKSNPVFQAQVGKLGPRFNQTRCIECHVQNGRSVAPAVGVPLTTMSVLTASASTGVQPDPVYGHSIQQRARSASDPDYSVTVQQFESVVRTLADGEKVTLSRPVYGFKGPVPAGYSVRQASQVIGLGLLEAVPESAVLALADPLDKNGDGVRGVPNWVSDPESGQNRLGRFGWKAAKASLRHQTGDALMKDLGIVSPVYPSRSCHRSQPDCRKPDGSAGITEADLQRFSQYLSLIGVPAQRSLRSGYPEGIRVSPEHDVNPVQIERGRNLFVQAKCVACHVPQLQTGNGSPFAELRNQTIHPYTDLLLHDMGPDLADSLTEGQAGPRMWRTAPLWGIGSLQYVQGGEQNVRYLHDGRARTLTEAILWHAGEAAGSRAAFEGMPKADREAILAFLRSL